MFGKHIERGVLEVISPPADFYPNLTALRPTLGDEPERVQWRSKQVRNDIFSHFLLNN
jgi:alpha-1,3-mannosylglycoprotein beta-1,4-N-acetylglucosaminyltransferase A/B